MILKHPYYKDNPHLELRKCVAHDGTLEYAANCVKLANGKYYRKGIDLTWDYISETWVADSVVVSTEEYFDHEKQVNVLRAHGLMHGLVEVNPITGEEKMGYFSTNLTRNCIVTGRSTLHVLDYKLLQNGFYTEDIANGQWYKNSELSLNDIKRLGVKKLAVNNRNCQYNLIDNIMAMQDLQMNYARVKLDIDKNIRVAARYLKNLTFGAEFETINGTLPRCIAYTNGIMICKDGSIRDGDVYPPEYVTIPLSGEKGLQTLRNSSIEIAKRSDISNKCSYHLHLGGFVIDRLLMVCLFKLCYKIQDDIFKMFPKYKTNEIKYANKEKNYCKKLPNVLRHYTDTDFNDYINRTYQEVFSFLTGGREVPMANKSLRVKQNPWGGHKWDIASRYYWVNFINPVFGKQDTIEFRLHTPTLNPDKVVNWLFICNAIIRFAQTNQKQCLDNTSVSIEEILNYYKTSFKTKYSAELSQKLYEYYINRVEYFAADNSRENYLSPEELLEDNFFKFNCL